MIDRQILGRLFNFVFLKSYDLRHFLKWNIEFTIPYPRLPLTLHFGSPLNAQHSRHFSFTPPSTCSCEVEQTKMTR